MKIAAVVVTYNRLELLKQCAECVLAQAAPCELLVVDNASTDGTGEWARELADENPRVHYLNTGVNLGGAGGFNLGMRWAAEKGYSHIWLMDDDTLPKPDALERLLDADRLLGGEYGYLASVVLWTDGTECKMNRQKLKKSYYKHVELLKHGIIEVEQSTFVSLLFPLATVQRVGLPIKDFFIWGDDIEYTRRIAVRNKLASYMVGQSQVVHAMRENTGSSIATDAPERIARYNYAFRNENYLYRQEGVRGFAYYTAKCALNFLRVIARAKSHKPQRLWVIIKQYFAGVWFNPKVEITVNTECMMSNKEQE